jgi:hypothetical protein
MRKSLSPIFLAIPLWLSGCTPFPPSVKSWAYSGPGPAGDLDQHEQALKAAVDACAIETGESGMPGFWSGYSRSFTACMKTKGWERQTNPM